MVRERPRRLVLAYVIVALAAVALIGAIAGSDPVMISAASFGYLFAIWHGISFYLRVRRRRAPARLDAAQRRILGTTLAVIAAAGLGNLFAVSLVVKGHKEVPAAAVGPISMWMILTAVLCWRAWLVKSARRAGIVQLVAVLFAAPSMISPAMDAFGSPHHPSRWMVAPDQARMLLTGMFIGLAVVACAGPVLDKLFASVDDGGDELVPEAIVRG